MMLQPLVQDLRQQQLRAQSLRLRLGVHDANDDGVVSRDEVTAMLLAEMATGGAGLQLRVGAG